MMYNEINSSVEFAPTEQREELLAEAFDLILCLQPEQLAEIMGGIK